MPILALLINEEALFYTLSLSSSHATRKPGPEDIKLYFVLNSTEHEIYPAQRC